MHELNSAALAALESASDHEDTPAAKVDEVPACARSSPVGEEEPDGLVQEVIVSDEQHDGPDVVSRLRQLKQLLDEGLIDQDDFDAKKAALLMAI